MKVLNLTIYIQVQIRGSFDMFYENISRKFIKNR